MDDRVLKQRVLKAVWDWEHQREPQGERETNLDFIARLAQVPRGHVRAVCESYNALFSGVDLRGFTPTSLERIEADLLLPIDPHPPSVGCQTFNVNVGDHGQVQTGNVVSGNSQQMTVTYQQVLEELVNEVQRSDLPEEEKKTAIERIKAVLGSTTLANILKLTGGIAAIASSLG